MYSNQCQGFLPPMCNTMTIHVQHAHHPSEILTFDSKQHLNWSDALATFNSKTCEAGQICCLIQHHTNSQHIASCSAGRMIQEPAVIIRACSVPPRVREPELITPFDHQVDQIQTARSYSTVQQCNALAYAAAVQDRLLCHPTHAVSHCNLVLPHAAHKVWAGRVKGMLQKADPNLGHVNPK